MAKAPNIFFDSDEAESYARSYAYKSAREIAKTTRQAFRTAVSSSIAEMMAASAEELSGEEMRKELIAKAGEELTAEAQAKLIKQMLGLDRRRASAALEYRAQLIREGLPSKKVREKFGIEVRKKLRSRARTIGRTEAARAKDLGKLRLWEQQVKTGILDRASVRVIDVTLDDKTCPICREMDGKRIPLLNKAGTIRAFKVRNKIVEGKVQLKGRWQWFRIPPFHINCRCDAHIEFAEEPA